MRTFLYLITALFVQGCALHQPMSELSIFKALPGEPDSTYRGSYGIVATGSSSYESAYGTKLLKDLNRESGEVAFENPNKFGAGFYFTRFAQSNEPSMSLSAGFALLGADITIPLARNFFITLSGSAIGGWQFIAQKRVYYDNNLGASLGVNFRSAFHWVETGAPSPENLLATIGPEDTDFVHTIGIKGMVLYNTNYEAEDPGPGGLRVNVLVAHVSLGYAPALRTPVASLTIGLLYFRKRRTQH